MTPARNVLLRIGLLLANSIAVAISDCIRIWRPSCRENAVFSAQPLRGNLRPCKLVIFQTAKVEGNFPLARHFHKAQGREMRVFQLNALRPGLFQQADKF